MKQLISNLCSPNIKAINFVTES